MTLTSSSPRRARLLSVLAATVAAGLALAGCGSSTTPAAGSTGSTPAATSAATSAASSAPSSVALSSVALSSAAPSSAAPGSSTAETATFPVTVKNIYGETTIDAQPERVATVSWVNPDIALALGVVPVGMDEDVYGANTNGSTDWKDEALQRLGAPIGSDRAPQQWDASDGIDYDAIDAAQPDVILAAYSGLTQQEYEKLSGIAPVIGPVAANYTTSWQQATTAIGTALGKPAAAAALITDVEGQISAAAQAHPEFAGTTFIAANLDPTQTNVAVYSGGDTRPRFLTALGLTQAPVVEKNAKAGSFYYEFAGERADELDSDIIFSWVAKGVTLQTLQSNKLLGQIPAVRSGAAVLTSDDQLTLAISASSPLSLQWVLPQFVPMLATAVETAKKGS